MRYYYFLDDKNFIRIKAKKKPSQKTAPRNGCWVLREWSNGFGFILPLIAQITWGRLSRMKYIGSAEGKDKERE